MTIRVAVFLGMPFADSLFPPVGYLGLVAREFQETRSPHRRPFLSLAFLAVMTPALQVVQLLCPRNGQRLLTHRQVITHALSHELAGSKFRVVDHEGNLLSDRPRTM